MTFFKAANHFFLKENNEKMATSKPDETKPEVCDPLTYPTYAGSVDTKVTVGGYGNKLGPGTAHAGPLTNRQVALS